MTVFCITPDGKVLAGRNPKRLAREIERDVDRRDPAELRRLLVDDAVKRTATDISWATLAYIAIGRRLRGGAEQAFVEVCDEVEELTGLRVMPGTML